MIAFVFTDFFSHDGLWKLCYVLTLPTAMVQLIKLTCHVEDLSALLRIFGHRADSLTQPLFPLFVEYERVGTLFLRSNRAPYLNTAEFSGFDIRRPVVTSQHCTNMTC